MMSFNYPLHILSKPVVCCFFLILLGGTVNAQERAKLWLFNGQVIEVKTWSVGDSIVSVRYLSGRDGVYLKDDVFSVIDSTGAESILYKPEESERLLEPVEMKNYLIGMRTGRDRFSPWLWLAGGFGAGFAAGYHIDSFFGIVTPLVVAEAGVLLPVFPPKEVRDGDPFMRKGYKKANRKKRFGPVALGSLAGLIAGWTTN